MASSEGRSGGESALFSKLGGALFGGPNSPQKVLANVRGLLATRLTNSLDTGKSTIFFKFNYGELILPFFLDIVLSLNK